jgi:hypothetical protein
MATVIDRVRVLRVVAVGALVLSTASFFSVAVGQTAGAAAVQPHDQAPVTQLVNAQFVDPDPAQQDGFGSVVAVSGDGTIAVVGSVYGPVNSEGNSPGDAYVFELQDGAWSEVAQLVPSGDTGDYFGFAVTMTPDGSEIIITSDYQGPGGSQEPEGAAYVFVEPAGGWSGTIAASSALEPSDWPAEWAYGSSVSVSADGTVVALGAYSPGDPYGEGYVFVEPAGGWDSAPTLQETNRLLTAEPISTVEFGFSISISSDGSSVVVGAPADGNPTSVGQAYVYDEPATGGWAAEAGSVTETSSVSPGADGFQGGFGVAVSLSSDGSTMAIGAPSQTNASGDAVGAVYVYSLISGIWVLDSEFFAPDETQYAGFGREVALSADGSALITGAPALTVNGMTQVGAAYIYTSAGDGSWALDTEMLPSDASQGLNFGYTVFWCASSATVFIGAPDGSVTPSSSSDSIEEAAPLLHDRLLSSGAKGEGAETASSSSSVYGRIYSGSVASLNQAPLTITNANLAGVVGVPLALTTSGGSGTNAVSFAVSGDGCRVTGSHLSASEVTSCTVVATNAANGEYGSISSSPVTFQFVNLPAPPTSVTATSNEDSSSTVSWDPPTDDGGSTIVDYVVQYSADEGATWTTASATPSSSPFNVTGLSNGTPYVFEVAASNAGAVGAFSSPSAPATPASVPDVPNQPNVVAGNGVAVISWTAPNDEGSHISFFQVTMSTTPSGPFKTPTAGSCAAIVVAPSLSCTAMNLKDGQSYYFEVQANNALGASGFSVASTAATPLSPQAALVMSNVTTTSKASSSITLRTAGGSGDGVVSFQTSTAGCALTGSSLSVATAPTSCVVTATKASSGKYLSTTSEPVTFTFIAIDQAKLLIANSTKSASAGTVIALNTSGGSGSGSVSYSTSTPGCVVSGATLSVTIAPTKCVVTATEAASGIYLSATSNSVTFSFSAVAQAPLILSGSPTTAKHGTPIALSVLGGSGVGTVSYKVSGAGCSLTGNQLNASKAATCSGIATEAANGIYSAVSSVAVTFKFQ